MNTHFRLTSDGVFDETAQRYLTSAEQTNLINDLFEVWHTLALAVKTQKLQGPSETLAGTLLRVIREFKEAHLWRQDCTEEQLKALRAANKELMSAQADLRMVKYIRDNKPQDLHGFIDDMANLRLLPLIEGANAFATLVEQMCKAAQRERFAAPTGQAFAFDLPSHDGFACRARLVIQIDQEVDDGARTTRPPTAADLLEVADLLMAIGERDLETHPDHQPPLAFIG